MADSVPTGAVMVYAPFGATGQTMPEGFLECDGSAVSRTTYSDLFNLIGTTYGTGDGSTTFNIPDLGGRVPLGAGTGSGLTTRTLGSTGGSSTVTIGTPVFHSHTVYVANPVNFTVYYGDGTGSYPRRASGGGASSGYTGGGGSHQNMKNNMALSYMIKT